MPVPWADGGEQLPLRGPSRQAQAGGKGGEATTQDHSGSRQVCAVIQKQSMIEGQGLTYCVSVSISWKILKKILKILLQD